MKKRRLWEKTLAVALGMTMALSVSGVSVFAEEEPVEISIAVWNADECFQGDAVQTAIEEKLGIKIVPMNITWDDYTQKVQLWASSGSLPDVFVGPFRTTATYPQWANQGVISAIPEDLSAYPNLEEYLSGDAAEEAKLGGILYCIPRQTYPEQYWTSMDRIIAYRWDLAQEAGIEKEPETWEEFTEMILAIIEADPDGTGVGGMTAADKNLLSSMFMPYGSSIAVDGGSVFKWVKDEEGQYVPAYFTEDGLAGLQFGRDLYEAGVIEKDIALTTNQSAEEKFLQGSSAAILFAGGFGDLYSKVARYWEEIYGTEYLDDVKALNLMPDKDGNLSYPVMASYAWSESYINANVDEAKMDKILSLYDYLLSDEGAILSNYGPEGELYDMVDGKVVLHDQETPIKDTYPSVDALGILARWNPSTYDERFVANVPAEYTAVNNARVAQAAEVEIPEFYPECTQKVLELGIEFTVNLDEDFLTIMTGDEPVEDMWEEIYSQYEAEGLSEMIAQVNEAMAE